MKSSRMHSVFQFIWLFLNKRFSKIMSFWDRQIHLYVIPPISIPGDQPEMNKFERGPLVLASCQVSFKYMKWVRKGWMFETKHTLPTFVSVISKVSVNIGQPEGREYILLNDNQWKWLRPTRVPYHVKNKFSNFNNIKHLNRWSMRVVRK